MLWFEILHADSTQVSLSEVKSSLKLRFTQIWLEIYMRSIYKYIYIKFFILSFSFALPHSINLSFYPHFLFLQIFRLFHLQETDLKRDVYYNLMQWKNSCRGSCRLFHLVCTLSFKFRIILLIVFFNICSVSLSATEEHTCNPFGTSSLLWTLSLDGYGCSNGRDHNDKAVVRVKKGNFYGRTVVEIKYRNHSDRVMVEIKYIQGS